MGDQFIDYRPCLQTAVMQVPPCLFSGVLVQSPTSQSVNSLQLPLSASMAWEANEMLAFDAVIGMGGMESYSTALDTVAQFDDAASPSAYVCRPPADNFNMDDVVDGFSATTDTQFFSSDYSNNPMALQTEQESFDFYIPREEVAELEWLSQFVEGASLDVPYPYTGLAGAAPSGISQLHVDECAITRAARSKRPRISTAASAWHSVSPASSSPSFDFSPTQPNWTSGKSNGSRGGTRREGGGSEGEAGGVRRCTHCASEKTPQWRAGPLGPKTLCNACGVRYKSGRLVPEYRPAASPTFVLTQHSNSHRKIMEIRRLKALLRHHGNLLPSSAVARLPELPDDYGLI